VKASHVLPTEPLFVPPDRVLVRNADDGRVPEIPRAYRRLLCEFQKQALAPTVGVRRNITEQQRGHWLSVKPDAFRNADEVAYDLVSYQSIVSDRRADGIGPVKPIQEICREVRSSGKANPQQRQRLLKGAVVKRGDLVMDVAEREAAALLQARRQIVEPSETGRPGFLSRSSRVPTRTGPSANQITTASQNANGRRYM